jgi:hypothetical protein
MLNVRCNSRFIFLFASLLAASPCFAQTIAITAPSNGTIVYPGDTISVVTSSSVPVLSVKGSGPLPQATPTSAPNTYQLSVPATVTPGIYYLSAVGGSQGNLVFANRITIQVERSDVPTSIRSVPQGISFDEIGDSVPLQIYGEFANGEVDVTYSSYMSYTSGNEQIANVGTGGAVSAVGAGCTSVTAAYRGVSASIPVIIPFGQQPITYDITAALAVPIYADGAGHYGIILKVTNNSSAPLASFSITSATLNSVPASALPPSLVLTGCANRTLAGLTFPTTAGTPGAQAVLQINGAYVGALPGGVKGQSGTVTIPLTVQLP